MQHHPGGRFALRHNIGRDISKFFYGGYSLEGNLERTKPPSGHVHSNLARMIVQDLVVAKYEPTIQVLNTVCRVKEDEIYTVNSMIKTFVFESLSG